MKKKLSSLYCTFVPCKSFVSDFFIVEKTFAFYEKLYFRRKKLLRFFVLLFSKAETFAKMGKNREVSAPKVYKENISRDPIDELIFLLN